LGVFVVFLAVSEQKLDNLGQICKKYVDVRLILVWMYDMITFKSIDQAWQQMSYGFVKTDLLSFDDNITQKLFFGLIRLRFWIFQK